MNQGFQLVNPHLREQGIQHASTLFMKARIDFRKHSMGCVESIVKWGMLEEWLGLIVDHFVQLDIRNMKLVWSNTKSLSVLLER